MRPCASSILPLRQPQTRPRLNIRTFALVIAVASIAASACSSDPPTATASNTPATSVPPSTTTTPEPPATVPGSTPVGAAAFLGPIKLAHLTDTTIGYRQFGDGAPLLMIMGSDAAMTIWDYRLLESLAIHARVTIFDNPGVASSTTGPDRTLSIESMGQDTISLMDALGIERANVMGWSMGSYVALMIATQHPDRVDRLIIAAGDAGSPRSPQGSAADLAALADPATPTGTLLELLFPASADAAMREYLAAYAAVPQEQVDSEIRRRQFEAIDVWARDPGLFDRLAEISQPVLVAHGDQDRIVPVENAHILARLLPDATLRIFPGAGHGFLFQEPGRLGEAIAEFLAEEPAPGRSDGSSRGGLQLPGS